jgi:Flp pilus assembly protein TadB
VADETRSDATLGDQARALKEDLAPSRLEGQLQDAVSERPMVRHLLATDIVVKAVAAAVVVALILWLLISAQIAAIALVAVFFATWLTLARISYDRRRETRDTRDDAEPDSA